MIWLWYAILRILYHCTHLIIQHGQATPQHGAGDHNSEQSTELATPWRAADILPAHTPPRDARSPYIDPPSIPLPPSPLSSNSRSLSPLPSAPLIRNPQPLWQPPSSTEDGIRRIENELMDARRDLLQKEAALNELRLAVDDLQQQVLVGSSS
jgi:hypothetical protein